MNKTNRLWITIGALLIAGLLPAFTTAAPSAQVDNGKVQRNVTYCTVGGEALKMDIFQPNAGLKPAPVVVYLHGGSWVGGDKYEIGLAGRRLADRGYVVAAVNYRLAPQHKWPAQIEDARCAVRYLRANAARYNLDPKRIAAWGSSAGGQLAALLGLAGPQAGFDTGSYREQSGVVQAVVDMFGPSDLTAFSPDEYALGVAQAVFGVSKGQSTEPLKRASPVTYVSSAAPPFLILHGNKDSLVPLSQSQELYNKLKASGAQAELVIVENGEHGFVPKGGPISPTVEQIANLIQNFLDRTLGNVPSEVRLFPQTGQQVGGAFLQHWLTTGGLPQYGYPISGERQERSPIDGKLYTVQYFERAMFEFHPENRPPADVLPALLGTLRYRAKYPGGAPDQQPNTSGGSVLFSQTGKRLGGRFLDYWRAHGGLSGNGYPISDEFSEVSPVDGKPYRVQYFERAVLEFHPENSPAYDVLPALLGTLRLRDSQP